MDGALKMLPAFPVIKVMVTLAFLALAFKSPHRQMSFAARL